MANRSLNVTDTKAFETDRTPGSKSIAKSERVDESSKPRRAQSSASELALHLGGRLKHARLLLGFSLRQVAEAAGITEGYVSKLENDRVRPSLATLHRLANILQTTIGELVSEADPFGKNVVVVLRDRRQVFQFTDGRAGVGTSLEKLIPSRPNNLLQANIHVVAPGGGSEELISHRGQEFGFVLEGQLELLVGDEVYWLSEGDAFCFNSELPHGYRNKGEATARIVWVNTPPTF